MSNPIDSDTNVTALLIPNALDRYPGSLGSQFEDGAMLANDNGFLLYGGNIQPDPQGKPPDRDEIIGYQLYHHGADRRWEPHWDEVDLDDKTNRYITYGGAASAPSENKAWYFSGMTSPTHGEIFIDGTANVRAKKVSRALIEVDMEIQSSEKWTNKTLPPTVEGRANPEVIWVPVGDKGILVVLGGVVYPQWVTTAQKSEDPEASVSSKPSDMKRT